MQFGNLVDAETSHDEVMERDELMLLRAVFHVKSTRAQRKLYQTVGSAAVLDAKNNVPHSRRTYTFVVDYGQNMEMPAFNQHQPGETYYYSPLSVYNLGVVDTAHMESSSSDPCEHMHAHVYHQGVGKKGGNNVASLLLHTMKLRGLLREGEPGAEFNCIFDNCGGQNKNTMVLRLVPYLVEMGYFKKVNFIFLVVGHTKNAADRLFNALKQIYRQTNIGTMEKLYRILDQSKKVTVHRTTEENFLDIDAFLGLFYSDLAGLIKSNHIFSCGQSSWEGNRFMMQIRECDLPDAKSVRKNMIKTSFYKRKSFSTYSDAVRARREIMTTARRSEGKLAKLAAPGINPYTQVELYSKFAPCLHDDDATITCPKPSERVFNIVGQEKKDRKKLKLDLIEKKKEAVKAITEVAVKAITDVAFGAKEEMEEGDEDFGCDGVGGEFV